jgi:hypothetical protein
MRAVEFRKRLLVRKRLVALAAAVVFVALIGFPLRPYISAALNPPVNNNDVDLSALFKSTADRMLDAGDFVDLRDPACTKSFSLRLAQPVFIRMSRNCTYSIFVEDGRARANFLNAGKGAVELAPGRSWSARDFWSLIPLTTEAYVRLEPAP